MTQSQTLSYTTNFRMIQTESVLSGDKINVTDILKFVLERVKNILGNGDNAGDQ